MKMLKIALVGIIGLVLLGVVAFYVDYYYYSWTSYVNPFGCSCKQITGKNTDKIEQEYDLTKIFSEVEKDSRYKSELLLGKKYLKLSRLFNKVNYDIEISKGITSTGRYTEVKFGNNGIFENISEYGEVVSKTTPNYYIEQNINQMIDEMPLSDSQKLELKSRVTVGCRSSGNFGTWH